MQTYDAGGTHKKGSTHPHAMPVDRLRHKEMSMLSTYYPSKCDDYDKLPMTKHLVLTQGGQQHRARCSDLPDI